MEHIEIMAPVGSWESLSAALQGGADAIYFGVAKLNMRSRSANNFAPEDLPEIVRICREAGVKTYLTLNITLFGEDIDDARKALQAAKDAGVDAVIASDMAVILHARAIGMDSRKGALQRGKDADIVIADRHFNVRATFVGGECVYRAQ